MASELLQKISEFGYVEGGIQNRLFSAQLNEKSDTLVVAVNNADYESAYAPLFNNSVKEIVEGAKALAEIHGASNIVLHIPEICSDSKEKIEKAAKDITVVVGMVGKRNYPDAIYHHVVTAINVNDIKSGKYTDGIYASVNGNNLEKYNPDTKLRELAEKHGIEVSAVSGILSGYKLYDRSGLSMTICEAYPENGAIRFIMNTECEIDVVSKIVMESYKASCGKCVFCREGLLQLAMMLKDVTEGKGKAGYVEITREIASTMNYSTLCTLGQHRGDIAINLMDNFMPELTKHIKRKKCTPGVCFSNDTVYVDPKMCNGCAECLGACPKDAIYGKAGYIHMVDDLDCNRCGECLQKCSIGAIKMVSTRAPKTPDRLTRVGQFKKI